jgi:hypothetical protein
VCLIELDGVYPEGTPKASAFFAKLWRKEHVFMKTKKVSGYKNGTSGT